MLAHGSIADLPHGTVAHFVVLVHIDPAPVRRTALANARPGAIHVPMGAAPLRAQCFPCIIGNMRVTLLIALLAALPCGAQDLPDPGRRLSQEELNADPDKPRAPHKARPADPRERARDAQACEGARRYYQIACKAPESHASRSMQCAEAYAMYRQACP